MTTYVRARHSATVNYWCLAPYPAREPCLAHAVVLRLVTKSLKITLRLIIILVLSASIIIQLSLHRAKTCSR